MSDLVLDSLSSFALLRCKWTLMGDVIVIGRSGPSRSVVLLQKLLCAFMAVSTTMFYKVSDRLIQCHLQKWNFRVSDFTAELPCPLAMANPIESY